MTTYRISVAARLLGVSVDTVRRWADSGKLAVTRDASGRRQIDGEQLAAFAGSIAGDGTEGGASAGHSVRNRLTAIVTKVTRDTVMAQVEMAAGPYRLVSLISREAADELGLQAGQLVVASVKATNVSVDLRAPD